MLFKICNPDSADDERRFFFGMSKYVGNYTYTIALGWTCPLNASGATYNRL